MELNLPLTKSDDGLVWYSKIEMLLKNAIVPGFYCASGMLSYKEAQEKILSDIENDIRALQSDNYGDY